MSTVLKNETSGSDMKPSLSKGAIYALPVVFTTFLTTPFWSALPGIYAKYFGLGLPVIATIMLIGRLFDAATDPMVGYISDNYYAKTGSRKPFMLTGCFLFIICSYFLFVPTANISPLYFLIWSLAFYLSWTIFQVPHLTWGAEIAGSLGERQVMYSFRAGAVYLGLLLFYAVPLLPLFETDEITPQTLKWSFFLVALVLPIFALLLMRLNPTSRDAGTVDVKKTGSSHSTVASLSLFNLAKNLLKNKPFLMFIAAYVFCGGSIGMWYGLIFIYVDAYLQLGNLFAGVFMMSFIFSLILIPIWYRLLGWIGKIYCWALSTLFFIIACICTPMLNPGETGFITLLLLKMLTEISFVVLELLPPLVLSDIVDYSSWKYNLERRGTFFSIYFFTVKTVLALGAAVGLWIAGAYGFDPSSTSFSAEAVFGLKIAIGWLPAVVMAIAFIFIALTPLNARRNNILRRRLDSRERQLSH